MGYLKACVVAALVLFAGCGREAPRNLILIVVDTLRYDHLSFAGYPRPTTPELDRWVDSGTSFDRTWATSSWTLPSMASLLTGTFADTHGAGRKSPDGRGEGGFSRLDERLETLSGLLAENGLATGAIVNNPFLRAQFGLGRGFSDYDEGTTKPGNSRHRLADETVDVALDWIARQQENPFFLLVHIFDPHMRYDAPEPFRGKFTEPLGGRYSLPVVLPRKIRKRAPRVPADEREFIIAAYDEEIAFVDLEIERFFRTLEERNVWDTSLVVLTSDHGEELFEHDGFEHGHALWEEVLRVPLVLWGPGVEPARRSEPASLADVMPSVLDALGIAAPSEVEGLSLWPATTGGAVADRDRSLFVTSTLYGASRRAVVRFPWKLSLGPGPADRLFDLSSDPREASDLSKRRPEVASRLRQTVEAMELAASEISAVGPAAAAELDEDLRRELSALGYVDR